MQSIFGFPAGKFVTIALRQCDFVPKSPECINAFPTPELEIFTLQIPIYRADMLRFLDVMNSDVLFYSSFCV
jgi:hypothetical protein